MKATLVATLGSGGKNMAKTSRLFFVFFSHFQNPEKNCLRVFFHVIPYVGFRVMGIFIQQFFRKFPFDAIASSRKAFSMAMTSGGGKGREQAAPVQAPVPGSGATTTGSGSGATTTGSGFGGAGLIWLGGGAGTGTVTALATGSSLSLSIW